MHEVCTVQFLAGNLEHESLDRGVDVFERRLDGIGVMTTLEAIACDAGNGWMQKAASNRLMKGPTGAIQFDCIAWRTSSVSSGPM